jgi:predicted nucleic acid-binding protein
MPEAISNASPLIQLSKIDQLSLLAQLHERVLIPHAVHHEIVVAGKGREGADAIACAVRDGWMAPVAAPQDRTLHLLNEQIDYGEAEAIRIALEQPLSTVLLDDLAARSIAIRLGIKVTGIVGILLRAKQTGLVPRIRPLIEKLRAEGRFYISAPIVSQILKAAGE